MKKFKIGTLGLRGYKSALKNGLEDFIKKEKLDVLCLQDIKVNKEDFSISDRSYDTHYNSRSMGVIFKKKNSALRIKSYGNEIMLLEFKKFYLINVYLRPKNYFYVYKELLSLLRKLRKPLILVGDFNAGLPSNRDLSFIDYKHLNHHIEKLIIEFDMYDVFMFLSRFDGKKSEYPKNWNFPYTYVYNLRDKKGRKLYYVDDHILFSKNLVKKLKKFYVRYINLSDHFPLIAEFKDL